jgi:protoheme IX farnesyltransferase
VVGAIVGGIPPIMGWTAARNEFGPGAWALFAILFIWQFPHFFSIAWIYREDYLRGGFRMISVADESGRLTARQVALLSAVLIPVSLLPVVLGMAGARYALSAMILGVAFLGTCLWLSPGGRMASARRSFIGSIAYLPALLIVFMLDRM